MTKKKPEPNAAKQKYEPTSEEKTAIGKLFARPANPAPRLKLLTKALAGPSRRGHRLPAADGGARHGGSRLRQ
jgi:hypothetical protein